MAIALQDSLGDTERAGALFAKAQSLSTSINDYDALFRHHPQHQKQFRRRSLGFEVVPTALAEIAWPTLENTTEKKFIS